MTRCIAMLAVALLPVFSPGQTITPLPNGTTTAGRAANQAPIEPLSAVLMNDVDARHVKVGDPVKGRTYSRLSLADGVRVPPGSVMTGHITDVSRLGKGSSESRLAVVFDQVQISGGQTQTVHMGIAGLAAAPPPDGLENQSEMSASIESPFPGARSTGTAVDPSNQRRTAGTTGGSGGTRVTRGMLGQTTDAQNDGRNSIEEIRPRDHIGAVASVGSTVPGISLRPSPAERSVLVSTSHNIELRAGTPLVLLPISGPLP